MVILFTIKNHFYADDYAAAVCAIKSTQLKQGRTNHCVFFNARTVSSLFGKRFNLCRSQNDAQNKKTFSQQTIHVQIKDQPLESDRTHFYVRFNKSNVAMHRQAYIFLLTHKITTVQQKTTNRNNQSHQTIRKNYLIN